MKTSGEIRSTFLEFFQEQGHKIFKSSSLVPADDPTILFTNAGMNQFKDVFLGLEGAECKRAVTCQKCMRVSGKHNDLDTVGRTPLHHTFFEMLGNFSFGNYFKKEAIQFAWALCSEVYGLPRNQLHATVYEQDEEAFNLWSNFICLPPERIHRMGSTDNFWSMGETGPCGPCSELHFDQEFSPLGHESCSLGCDCGRYVEIWNLVFMQLNRDIDGQTLPLPSPAIDTGMGLERITAILQGVTSNYDTDLFQPIIQEAANLTGTKYGNYDQSDLSLRILADHSRACAFLISDGVMPDNEGRGYVLRKIMRRAIRHGQAIGTKDPFLFKLTDHVASLMRESYPELESQRQHLSRVVQNEENKFRSTLEHGIGLFNQIVFQVQESGLNKLPGKELFRLYDTYGFPLDLAKDLAQEQSLAIDETGFYEEMENQRQRARASWKGTGKILQSVHQKLVSKDFKTGFTGYTELSEVSGSVLALIKNNRSVTHLLQNEEGEILLDRSPFYPESGGQVGDQGILETHESRAQILDTYRPAKSLQLSRIRVQQGKIKIGDKVSSTVHKYRRRAIACNHTATHLIHAALRQILGDHIRQEGSLVTPDRFRFDFTHFRPPLEEELSQIESIVNYQIRLNNTVTTQTHNLEQALKMGATALFGEKYESRVRVVTIADFSTELCGGTHVKRTGEIGLLKITSEGSVSAGVRRIEALTGEQAMEYFVQIDTVLSGLSAQFKTTNVNLQNTVDNTLEDLKSAHKQVETLQLKLAHLQSKIALEKPRNINGIDVLVKQVTDLDRNSLRQLADQLKKRLISGVVVLGMAKDKKVSLVAMVSDDLGKQIRADDLIQRLAPLVDGRGGGNPHMAEAGGKDPSQLTETLEGTYLIIEELLS